LVNSSNIHIHNYLVLPATGQRRVLQEAFDQFSRIELSGAILTKLDESIGLGDVLGVCMSNRLPVCYTTNGQRVPEDLEVAKGSKLVQLAMAYMEDDRNA
jgi:flagellar biosynthesis protein FlhF